MKELNEEIEKMKEAWEKLVESIGKLANNLVKYLANVLFPIPKSNNWLKMHKKPMRRKTTRRKKHPLKGRHR